MTSESSKLSVGAHAAFALFVAACSGCSGGGSTQPIAQITQAAPKTVVIDAQGDSTMFGTEVINGQAVQTARNVPTLLQESLRQTYGSSVTVVNNGVSESTYPQRLQGIAPHYSQSLTDYLKTDSAQIVIGNWALNDAINNQEYSVFTTYLVEFVNEVRAAGKIPVLEEPNPTTDPARSNLAAYVYGINYVATQMNVPLVKQFDYIRSLPDWQSMLTDGIHPSDQMYAIKAQREYDVIAPLVKTLQ
jgi:acyl-CoA thioesterase-1